MTKLDDMLSKWPMPEQDQLAADEAAERVVAAVEAGQLPASIDESLLAAPLPKTLEDQDTIAAPRTSRPGVATRGIGVESKMAKDRTRDRTSFQELAKLAQTTPPPPASSTSGPNPAVSSSGPHAPASSSGPQAPSSSASGSLGVVRGEGADSSDSGIVDLKAIASADPSGSQRAQSTPLASQGLFDDESAPPKPAVSEKAAAAAVASAVAQPASAKKVDEKKPVEKKADKKEGGGGIVIVLGTLTAVAAIAAGVFFYVKSQRAHQTVAQTTTVTTPTTPGDKVKAQPGTAAAGAVSVAQADTEVDTQSAAQTGGGGKPIFKFHSKPGVAAGGASATPDTTATAAGGIDPRLQANIPVGNAGGGSGDLAEAMKQASGGGTGLGGGGAATGGGGGNTGGSIQPRPSQGQVTGVINSVMPSVRACLGSDDPVSRATVTFQSDGTVKSVNVTGFAAGKPQEACIKSALSKAALAPFAEATYPVPITIRPN